MRKSKMNIYDFKKFFYEEPHSVEEIAKHFGVSISYISTFRKRNNLPKRGWAYGHPQKGISRTPWNKGHLGSKSTHWKGGRHYSKDGYVLVYNPEYPFKSSSKYIGEHRLVMEQHLGRRLSRREVVHHINHDKKDNRIENLQVVDPRTHVLLHPEVLFKSGHKLHKR